LSGAFTFGNLVLLPRNFDNHNAEDAWIVAGSMSSIVFMPIALLVVLRGEDPSGNHVPINILRIFIKVGRVLIGWIFYGGLGFLFYTLLMFWQLVYAGFGQNHVFIAFICNATWAIVWEIWLKPDILSVIYKAAIERASSTIIMDRVSDPQMILKVAEKDAEDAAGALERAVVAESNANSDKAKEDVEKARERQEWAQAVFTAAYIQANKIDHVPETELGQKAVTAIDVIRIRGLVQLMAVTVARTAAGVAGAAVSVVGDRHAREVHTQ
jgi:hypothetical protein